MTKPYPTDRAPAPGDYEHRAFECERHGVGVGCRPYKSTGPFECVACLLEVGKPAPAIEAVAARPGNGHDAAPVVVTEPLPNKIVPALEPLPTMRSGGICPKCGPWIDTHPCEIVVESPARTRELIAQYDAENTRLQQRITELERRQEQAIEVLRGGG